jgi:putative SOS response-associated peptidase YedK
VPEQDHGRRHRRARIHVAASGLRTGAAAGAWQNSRRCIFPMQGFYLWQRLEDGTRRPWFASLARQKTFGVAGLWDRSTDGAGNLHFFSAAMITLPLRDLLPELDDRVNRLPVIVPAESYDDWLGADAGMAERLLRPLPHGELRAWRVGPQVNDPANRGPSCAEPLESG